MGFKRLLSIACPAILLLGIGAWQGLLPWFVLLIALFVVLLIIVIGASRIDLQFFLPTTTHYPVKEKKIALTFDDGPHTDFTLPVASLMEQHDGRATFFCIGQRIQEYPHIAEQLHQRGHQIANHSFTHAKWIDFGSKRGWISEIRQTDEAILKATGERNTCFRPPYGVTTPHLSAAIRKTGHQVIGWRVRPYDTAEQDPERIAQRILKQVKPGDIILLHDTHDRVIPALERLLPQLAEQGYKLVTVEELARHV